VERKLVKRLAPFFALIKGKKFLVKIGEKGGRKKRFYWGKFPFWDRG